MAYLAKPTVPLAHSVRDAARQFNDDAWDLYTTKVRALADAELDDWVDSLVAESNGTQTLSGDYVHRTHFWWVEDEHYLGRLNVYHELTSSLREDGGHIGYYIVPTYRRMGHASAMLAAVLPRMAEMNIGRALLMCDVTNIGSRRVIESNGGQLEGERNGQLRFWVPTS